MATDGNKSKSRLVEEKLLNVDGDGFLMMAVVQVSDERAHKALLSYFKLPFEGQVQYASAVTARQ